MLTAFEIGYRVVLNKQAGAVSELAKRVGGGILRGGAVGGAGGAAVGALGTPAEGESRLGNAMSAGAKGMAAGALLGGAHSGYKHNVNARMGPPKPPTPLAIKAKALGSRFLGGVGDFINHADNELSDPLGILS